MIVLEFKLEGAAAQYAALNEAIRTMQFIRNKCVRKWMDERGVKPYDLNRYCAILAKEYDFAGKLNSQARQAAAERAGAAILRFYKNCRAKMPGTKGYPQFQRDCRSVEYKQTGWTLDETRTRLTLTDGFKAGTFRLRGTRDILGYARDQIKRVRIVKRADGYYAIRARIAQDAVSASRKPCRSARTSSRAVRWCLIGTTTRRAISWRWGCADWTKLRRGTPEVTLGDSPPSILCRQLCWTRLLDEPRIPRRQPCGMSNDCVCYYFRSQRHGSATLVYSA